VIRDAGTRVSNIVTGRTEAYSSAPAAGRLRQLDQVLALDGDDFAARAERAGLLREQGRFEEAKRDYLELLRRKPDDFAALNDFGTLVLNAGYSAAARSLFAEAVRHHPGNPNGRVNLGNLLYRLGEESAAREQFEAALAIDPGHIHAHRGLGNVLAALGDTGGAKAHRDQGFKGHAVTVLPYRGEGTPIAVLLLVSAAGGNIPTSALLDERQFSTTVLVTEYAEPAVPLPPHDLVFNSIGDADLCQDGLQAAMALLSRTAKPVINHPAQVLKTGRADNAERLRSLPDVVVPRMAMVPKRKLMGDSAAAEIAACGFGFPLLVRAVGFHTGYHFAQVATTQELSAAVKDFPGDEVCVIERLDARDSKGMYRKYRAMFVDGTLYPLHLAVSRDWKVHYFTADMAESPVNRAKDEAFLADMTSAIGQRAIAGLERIRSALALDYGGVDFAVNAQGEILFFEANATMVVYPPTTDPKWAYRSPAVEAVLAAVRTMLVNRAGVA
jgi:tetratricopeptide (TPR) repeat protein